VQDKVSPECFCSVIIDATGSIGNVSADNELAVGEVFEYVSNHAGIEKQSLGELQVDDDRLV
jgi:hypothetical protein